jgi:hypothetical protein
MKLFLSWSGKRSQMLAHTLRDWLPLVLHYLKPWVSEEDVDAGERCAAALARELEASDFGILCLTRENIESRWLLFEAGSLAKSLDRGKVVPFLLDLDLRDISGPLAQFQAKKVDRAATAELVRAINRVSATSVEDSTLTRLFDALWPQFEARVKEIPERPDESGPKRPPGEVLEDLVATVRSIDQRMRGLEDAYSRGPAARGTWGQEDVVLMLLLLLPQAERQHLLNLASGRKREYTGNHAVRTGVRHLRSLGLLRMRRDRHVGQMEDGLEFDLAAYVELTELGKRWVRKLQEIEAGEALDDVSTCRARRGLIHGFTAWPLVHAPRIV